MKRCLSKKNMLTGCKAKKAAAFSVAAALLMGATTTVYAESHGGLGYTDNEYGNEYYPTYDSEDDNYAPIRDEDELFGGEDNADAELDTDTDVDSDENNEDEVLDSDDGNYDEKASDSDVDSYDDDEEEEDKDYNEEEEDELYVIPQMPSAGSVIGDAVFEDITVELGEVVRIVDGGSVTGTIFVNAGGELHLEDGGAINGTVILNGFGASFEMNGGVISGQGRGVSAMGYRLQPQTDGGGSPIFAGKQSARL